jgi:hypothetical protein
MSEPRMLEWVEGEQPLETGTKTPRRGVRTFVLTLLRACLLSGANS